MKQIPLPIGPDLEPSFETYLPGPNAMVLAQLNALRGSTTPVYLWGPTGSGKTHLLHAWVRRARLGGESVGGFSAGDPLPWTPDQSWSKVVLDDCHLLAPEEQRAAFALFIEAAELGIQVAAAGRLPPVDLPLREDLRTRLGWGLVLSLECLSETETRAVLRQEADRRGILLSDEVMGYLLTRFERDLKHLMQLLGRLDHYALGEGRPVTVPLLKRMLAERDDAEGDTT